MVMRIIPIGLHQAQKQIRDTAGKDLDDTMRQAHAKTARIVAARARAEAPSVTGALRSTIRGFGTTKSAVIKAGHKAKVPYAGIVHYGSRRITPNPYLERAQRSNVQQARSNIQQALDDLIGRKF
jgi:HK97 gp10 family phage protein